MAKQGTTKKTSELTAHGVSVQLPMFNKASPSSWFKICEANFFVRGITTSTTKYWHVVAKLDGETLDKIQRYLERDLGDDPFEDLKKHLCKVYQPTKQQRLDQFLTTTTQVAIIRRVFIRSLPSRIATAITGNGAATLEKLGDLADEAWEQGSTDEPGSSTVAAVARAAPRKRGFREQPQRPATRSESHQDVHRRNLSRLCRFHIDIQG